MPAVPRRPEPVEIFRRIALALTGASERAHHGHPDFRAHGRIFASLGFPDTAWGMVVLNPEQQERFTRAHASVFEPASGAWGRQGATMVRLRAADEETLGEALTLAWQFAAAKSTAAKTARRRKGSR
jgi:hypothetical protein